MSTGFEYNPSLVPCNKVLHIDSDYLLNWLPQIYHKPYTRQDYFQKLQISLAQSYKDFGEGTDCKNRASLYTDTAARECNGWNDITLNECEDKCTRNEMPENCQQEGGPCKYFQFNTATNWCQLGDATCEPGQADMRYILKMKQGLYLF